MAYPAEFVAGAQLPAADLNDYLFNTEYTYGETIAAGDALYLKSSDGKVYKTAMTSAEAANNFVGFAKDAGVLNDVKHILQAGQKVTGFVGLTAGAVYFLNEVAGTIYTIPGIYPVEVGIATSTTELLIYPKRFVEDYRFGDGSDGTLNFNGSTDVNSVSTRSGSVYTLTKNVYAEIINLSGTGTIIDTAGYQVYAKRGIFRLSTSNAKFRNNGGNGGNGGNGNATGPVPGAAGTAGTAAGANALPSAGAAGAGGAGASQNSAGTQNGSAGSAGGSITDSMITGTTLTAGAGGDATTGLGTGTGGAAGTSATNTQTKAMPRNYVTAIDLSFPKGATVTILRCGCSGPGGGGGGISQSSSNNSAAGGGGGAGASGGVLLIVSLAIVDLGTGTMFEAQGGNGGNGGNGAVGGVANMGAGGGGAGPGGHGGVILRLYRYLSGSAATSVTGGTKGSVGTAATSGTGTAQNGNVAVDGAVGTAIDLLI